MEITYSDTCQLGDEIRLSKSVGVSCIAIESGSLLWGTQYQRRPTQPMAAASISIQLYGDLKQYVTGVQFLGPRTHGVALAGSEVLSKDSGPLIPSPQKYS